VAAIDAASGGQSDVMTALRGERVEMVPLSEVAGKVKYVPDELLSVARALA
jgi:6-phosphofructokinase 1